jgi:predicted permease
MNGVTHVQDSEISLGPNRSWHLGIVSPGYFQTLGQPLLAGRDFTIHDGPNAPKVMVVNEALAQRYWPNQDPIGKRVTFTTGPGEAGEVREIVGVVKTVKLRSIIEESRAIAYWPLAQKPKYTPVLLVRTHGNPQSLIPMIRAEAAAVTPAPPCDIRTMAARVSDLLMPQQILTGILNTFGLVGLLLSATGIYAVIAYAVAQRTREIGIRIALGASTRDVLIPVLLKGALLLALGLAFGLALTLAGARVITALLPQIRQWDKFFLHGIQTWDPLTYFGAALAITAVTLLATYLPARRAARIDPMQALRYE